MARVVAVGQVITPNPSGRLPGRGAWVHPDCLHEATRRRAWGRALGLQGDLDLSLVLEPGALRV